MNWTRLILGSGLLFLLLIILAIRETPPLHGRLFEVPLSGVDPGRFIGDWVGGFSNLGHRECRNYLEIRSLGDERYAARVRAASDASVPIAARVTDRGIDIQSRVAQGGEAVSFSLFLAAHPILEAETGPTEALYSPGNHFLLIREPGFLFSLDCYVRSYSRRVDETMRKLVDSAIRAI